MGLLNLSSISVTSFEEDDLDYLHLNRRRRLVMTYIEQRALIDMVKNRKKETVIAALSKLKNPEKEAVERTRKALRESLSAKKRKGLLHDRFLLLNF